METRKLILEQAGHTVITAQSDEEIIAACRDFRFDVVIIGQGAEAKWKRDWSAHVREYCPFAKVLEVYMPGTVAAVKDADDWLVSPAVPTELATRVAALAGHRKSNRPATTSTKLPMPRSHSRELEQRIRQLCRRLSMAQGVEFESLRQELKTAMELWDRFRQEEGDQSKAA